MRGVQRVGRAVAVSSKEEIRSGSRLGGGGEVVESGFGEEDADGEGG